MDDEQLDECRSLMDTQYGKVGVEIVGDLIATIDALRERLAAAEAELDIARDSYRVVQAERDDLADALFHAQKKRALTPTEKQP